jgi:O-acetyl-ADP-ribose deacetylase (regulator of RNase III)
MAYIKTIEGNLLDFPPYCKTDSDKYIGISAIAHSCNTRMIMGGGIAKQIKNRYPQAYQADVNYISNDYDDNGQFIHPLGNFSKAEVNSKFLPNDRGWIYNMYTQAGIGTGGRQVHYEKFWQALKRVEQDLCKYDGSTPPVLGLPYGISCGLAGGNWGVIKAMIEDIFLDSSIECYIVKFEI